MDADTTPYVVSEHDEPDNTAGEFSRLIGVGMGYFRVAGTYGSGQAR